MVKLAEKIRREQLKFAVDMAKILQDHDIKTKKPVIKGYMKQLFSWLTYTTHLNWTNF